MSVVEKGKVKAEPAYKTPRARKPPTWACAMEKAIVALLLAQLCWSTWAIRVTHASDCGVRRGCWRVPEGCSSSADCRAMVTWRHERTQLIIEFEAELQDGDDQWIGVAFSKDRDMGNDTVFECHFSATAPGVFLSHNTGKTNFVMKEASQLLLKDSYVEKFDGRGVCGAEWKLDNKALDVDKRKDMHVISSGQYYLLIASGKLQKGNKKIHPTTGKFAPWRSNKPVRFCQKCSSSFANIDFV